MSNQGYEVVARFADGTARRGETWDFRPERAWFQLREPDAEDPERVVLEELKAVFFVRTLGGDAEHVEDKSFLGRDRETGRKAWVKFEDGECLAGWVDEIPETGYGFELFPVDDGSNNTRVFVVRRPGIVVKLDGDAESAARQHGRQEQITAMGVNRISDQSWRDFCGAPAPAPKPSPPGKRPPSRVEFLQDF